MSELNLPIYVISFKNPERKQRMINRFQSVGFNLIFTPEVYKDDTRITSLSDKEKYNKIDPRTWSIMLQHMDAIRDFYENTQSDLCIVCEDDIMISKNFKEEITTIIPIFNELKLDVLMLGFLLPFKIEDYNWHFPKVYSYSSESSNLSNVSSFNIHKYPNDVWGTQMYMISRSYAKFLLETFDITYAYNNIETYPYSCDWIITKNGNRALVYPIIALEEGVNLSDCYDQVDYHKRCFNAQYEPDRFI